MDAAGRVYRGKDVRVESKAEVKAPNIDVRFTPNSGHDSDIARRPLSAKSGLPRCNKFGEIEHQPCP